MQHTRICDVLGIEHPILSAPMAATATSDLAAAVSGAGGLGIIGATRLAPDALREQIRMIRERTDRPFGVGFISSAPDTAALMVVVLEERVPVITHSFADPTPYVGPIHALGLKIISQVQTVARAKVAAAAGVDVITAQGTEAGGHTGYSGTLPLIPAVVDVAGGIPIIAAGDISAMMKWRRGATTWARRSPRQRARVMRALRSPARGMRLVSSMRLNRRVRSCGGSSRRRNEFCASAPDSSFGK
jgi:NAD(P)H-dependent flavin oxidoreductase YrpB (nitropropane dioxygenase family)